MLDSLGSTFSAETVNFFTRNGKHPVEDEVTVDEALQCLEMHPRMRRRGLFPLRKGVAP
jgi:hypothetical protein